MKNKIQKFSKGDFRLVKPEVIFEDTNLVLVIGEGEVYRGSFVVRSENDTVIRGLVYPSSDRVHFRDQGFEGNPARVEFTYDGRGLKPGHVEEGKFTVVCTGGEYELSFTAIIEKPYITTSYGKIQSTEDFKKLAMKDFSEAGRLFRSKEFYEILKYENERIFYLYDNMRKWSLSEQAMEEFLVGIKQKECIFLTLPGEGMLFEDLTESTKGVISIQKNTWGYMPVRVEVVGEFLKVNKTEFSTEDFVGNNYQMEFFVNPAHLHAGRNYGRLLLVTPYETIAYDIEVLQNQEYHEEHHVPEFLMAHIVKEYVGYVAGRIELENWVDSSIERVVQLRKLDNMNEMYQLLQAHIYVIGNKIEEAKWILENYNYNRFAIGKDPITNCYYLFLTALIRGKGTHTERVLDEIGRTYMKYQDSWVLLAMLIHLDPRYKNPAKRLEVLEQQFEFGGRQVLFYLEAYLCYQEKPTLLKKLGDFEIQVLNFASKYRMMSKELSLYVANFASQQKNYSQQLFRILDRIYKMYDEKMILNTICTLLIKGNKIQKRYFKWYEKAVEAELKIAQLYEYYMLTLDTERMRGPLPRSIFLYFMHGNSLDYKKVAFLYANLLTYEVGGEDLFLSYREQMDSFSWRQLEKRRITEPLRVLYKRFCREDEMNPERIAAMKDICYSYLITTKVPNMNRVIVIEKDGTANQVVPYTSEGAVVRLYDKESRIVWESLEGRYYTDSITYDTKRLFYEPRFLEMVKKYSEKSGEGHLVDEKEEVTVEALKRDGYKQYDEQEVFGICSRWIRESNYAEDDYFLYLAFELFMKGQYDKVTLMYLANFYCGATKDMKKLWKVLKEYGVPSYKISERIITQMLFSEDIFAEERIFEDYYLSGNVYFRLKQSYLAYVSKQYVIEGREIEKCIFEIIARECSREEELPDVCKIALLKYFSDKRFQPDMAEVLHKVLRYLCEKQIVFPFFMNYKESWLREMQLYNKVIISYQTEPGNKVKLFYKVKRNGREELGYRSEQLLSMYETLHVKQFVLFDDEEIYYYFQETDGKKQITTEKQVLTNRKRKRAGKYGKVNAMLHMSSSRCKRAMTELDMEEKLADQMYNIY